MDGGLVMIFYDRLMEQRVQIRILLVLLAGMLVANIILSLDRAKSRSAIEVVQIPYIDVPTKSLIGYVPEASIYSFAGVAWKMINDWDNSGETDYIENLQKYGGYLDRGFQTTLHEQFKELNHNSQLRGRQRETSISAKYYNPEGNVKQISRNLWDVNMVFRVKEYVDKTLIKDILIEYPLRVEKIPLTESKNPYGLVLVGFSGEPKRIKDQT